MICLKSSVTFRYILSPCPQIGKILPFLWTKGGYVQVNPDDSHEMFYMVHLGIFSIHVHKSERVLHLGTRKVGRYVKVSSNDLFEKFYNIQVYFLTLSTNRKDFSIFVDEGRICPTKPL